MSSTPSLQRKETQLYALTCASNWNDQQSQYSQEYYGRVQ
jgi:hypothetical protein